jgi:hypothetical protein
LKKNGSPPNSSYTTLDNISLWPATSRLQYISRISDKNGLKENVKYFECTLNYFKDGNADMAGKTMRQLIENEAKNILKYMR